jgi:hypothetical protein
MLLCGAMVGLGLAAAARWGRIDVEAPPTSAPPLLRFARAVTLAVVSGLGAGLLVAGAGGRLAMRLLAATAGTAAQGRVTEADERVGVISTDGTIGVLIFVGVFFGLATGLLYMLIRRWLPHGWAGGLVYGALLLVVLAPHLDPLRRNNPDFDLVGPGWLALLVFGALTLVHGVVVAGIAGRYSQHLPLLSTERGALLRYAPVLVFAPIFFLAIPTLVLGLVFIALSDHTNLVSWWRSPAVTRAGRIALGGIAGIALPSFVLAVADIAGRGPA